MYSSSSHQLCPFSGAVYFLMLHCHCIHWVSFQIDVPFLHNLQTNYIEVVFAIDNIKHCSTHICFASIPSICAHIIKTYIVLTTLDICQKRSLWPSLTYHVCALDTTSCENMKCYLTQKLKKYDLTHLCSKVSIYTFYRTN